jgi:hypothetical protein
MLDTASRIILSKFVNFLQELLKVIGIEEQQDDFSSQGRGCSYGSF